MTTVSDFYHQQKPPTSLSQEVLTQKLSLKSDPAFCDIPLTPCLHSTRNSAIADKPRDAITGQSRPPNMVPFHMLGMVSYKCPIVTLSVRHTVIEIFDFKIP